MKAAILALAACAPRATAPPTVKNDVDPPVGTIRHFPSAATVARPELDFSSILPDPSDKARWPLAASIHPALEPRFPIAAALATPGISWTDLCALGAQSRRIPGK